MLRLKLGTAVQHQVPVEYIRADKEGIMRFDMSGVLGHVPFNQFSRHKQAAGLASYDPSAYLALPDLTEIFICKMFQYQPFHMAFRGHQLVADAFAFLIGQMLSF